MLGTLCPRARPRWLLPPDAKIEDQAAIGVGWMISILRLVVDAPYRVTLFVSSTDFSKAAQVWIQQAKGAKTDEPQLGHRGLHVDPSAENTSSQSIHSNASLRFMTSSVHLPPSWGRLLMQGMLCMASLKAFPLPYQRLRTLMKKCNGSKGLTTKAYRKVVARGLGVTAFRMYCGMTEANAKNTLPRSSRYSTPPTNG